MTTDPAELALDLIATAITTKTAADIGAPRLATAAARRCTVLAGHLVIALSPVVAATSRGSEEEALEDVRTIGDLLALLDPPAREAVSG